MKTHPLHVGYLVIGLIFLATAGAWALREVNLIDTEDVTWLGPVALIAAGSVGLVAALASIAVALPIGAISLRTSGVYIIMITLAFAQMVYYFAISWPAYGGEDGLSFYVRNEFPGVDTLQPLP